jgi:hypothetical protein
MPTSQLTRAGTHDDFGDYVATNRSLSTVTA